MAFWHAQHEHLCREIKGRLAGLLRERDVRPHVPAALAMVRVAVDLLEWAERHHDPVDVQRFDDAVQTLRQMLEGRVQEHRSRLFKQNSARQSAPYQAPGKPNNAVAPARSATFNRP